MVIKRLKNRRSKKDQNYFVDNTENKNIEGKISMENETKFTTDSIVKCAVCGKECGKVVGWAHVKRTHGLSAAEYREKYPDAPLYTKEYHDSISSSLKMGRKQKRVEDVISKEESDYMYDQDEIEEIRKVSTSSVDEIPEVNISKLEVIDLQKSPEEIINKLAVQAKSEQDKVFDNVKNLVPRDKVDILNYLISVFGKDSVKNSKLVEKFDLQGFLLYSLITDIVVNVKGINIDIEFPNSFWHNHDKPKEIRDSILKQNGWIIVNILDRIPNSVHVEKALTECGII
jgi:hypothetical protein